MLTIRTFIVYLPVFFLSPIIDLNGQEITPSDSLIEVIRTELLTEAMSDDFWLTPAKNGAHGMAAYTFASYYLGVNTEIADGHILDINNPALENMTFADAYFYIPNFMYCLLDERFNKNMSAGAEAHLLASVYNHLNEHAYAVNMDNVWFYSGSENHNAIRRVLVYLGGLALSRSENYSDATFSNGSTVQDYVTSGARFWKEYFRSRAEKGLEVEIHSPNYTKYTLSSYYALRDLSGDSDLRTLADLYLHLYWADKAQLYLYDNSIVGGAANRVYKKFIHRKFFHYPRGFVRSFGWTDLPFGQHPGSFALLCSDYRVPELISQLATTEKPNYLVSNASPGMVRNTGSAEDKFFMVFDEEGDSHVLSQSFVTPDYVMGTKLFNPKKEYAATAKQNNMSGVFFDDEDNNRIIVHGYSKLVDSKEKGYRDVVGVTGENCMVVWRPAEYKVGNALGTYIFITEDMYRGATMAGNWWFVNLGNAYLALRVVNGGWTVREIDDNTDGLHFLLYDADSPVIIECAQSGDYAGISAFMDKILANRYSFANNTLSYTSTAGDSYKVFRNSSTLPEINGKVVDFNVAQTYTSPYINGGKSSAPREVEITFNNQRLLIDYEELTMTLDTISTGVEREIYPVQAPLVYPNPSSSGQFHLREVASSWEIFSMTGRLVKKGSSPVIDISNYLRGVYIIKVGNHCHQIVY